MVGIKTSHGELLIDPEASEVTSDTGELRRNWKLGTFSIDTRRTQAVTGWIGGRSIELADVTFDIATPNASVAVQSLDERAISDAKSLLISLGARAVPTAGTRVPFSSEPVTGTLQIRAQAGLKLFRRALPGDFDRVLAPQEADGASGRPSPVLARLVMLVYDRLHFTIGQLPLVRCRWWACDRAMRGHEPPWHAHIRGAEPTANK